MKNEEGLRHVAKYIRPRLFKDTSSKCRGKSSYRNLRYAAPCKSTFKDERSNQVIVQKCTPHVDNKTLLKVAFHSDVGILICLNMRTVCIIDTVAIELRFISKQGVMMQLATAIKPLAKFQPLSKIASFEMLHSLHVVWIHALYMQCSPHSRMENTKKSCN